ncbi:MAG: glutamate mutase L [Anaerolineales bacterium]
MVDEHNTIESILVADCGTVATKLLLLERVESSYRFVAQAESLTTINPPWENVTVGILNAIEDLEQTTGRTIYASGHVITPREGLQGVDAFVVILSAPEPLRLIIAGLVREMSLESARRAAAATYASVEGMLYREGSLHSPEEAWARAVRNIAPDVVFLVGGVDGGASRPVMELADAIALGTSMLSEERRPLLLYAGNAQLRSRITKLLGGITEVEVVDNVRPSVDTEHLGPAEEVLEQYFIEKRLMSTPGVDTAMSWSGLPVQPTATAFGRVVEYLWHRENNPNRGVLGVDLGAASTTVAAYFDGRLYLSIFGEQGVAFGPIPWLAQHGLRHLLRWLPEDVDPERVLSLLHNRQLRPSTVPQEVPDLWVEQAVVREILRSALRSARPTWDAGKAETAASGLMPYCDPIIISGGGIVHMPRPGHALLTVLDGLEPVGISTVLLDINRAAPALGAVASIKPLAAASALESGILASLGTVISPMGSGRLGDPVLRMKITYEDSTELDVEAHYGDLEIWPLLPGQRATLEIHPGRRFDIGLGGPGRGGKVQAIGGLVGLVVDARGRPLGLPAGVEQRQKLLQRWIWDVGG